MSSSSSTHPSTGYDVEGTELSSFVNPIPKAHLGIKDPVRHSVTFAEPSDESSSGAEPLNDHHHRAVQPNANPQGLSGQSSTNPLMLTDTWTFQDGKSSRFYPKPQDTCLEKQLHKRSDIRYVLQDWTAMSLKCQETMKKFQSDKCIDSRGTARYFAAQNEEDKARADLQEMNQAIDFCISRLYTSPMAAAVSKTADLLNVAKRQQRHTYGYSTDISPDLLVHTFTKALYDHFDRTIISYLSNCDTKIPITKAEIKTTARQKEVYSKIDHNLCSGDISVEADKDSITCTWTSTSPVPKGGIPGIKNPFKKWMPKSEPEVIARTEWTWKDGEVTFAKED